MKVLVFGNVGSGKTTLLNRLKKFVDFEVIAVDDFRRKHGNGNIEGELNARRFFFEAVKENKNQFIECLGIGKVADELFDLLIKSDEQVICLTLLTSKETCLSRLANRIWDIPFHEPVEKVASLLDRTELKILAGEITQQWHKRQKTILISKPNVELQDIDNIASELIALIQQKKSLPEHTMNDVEIMLHKNTQEYYSNQYLSYQKKIIEKNGEFLDDRSMIEKFITQLRITGNIIDIGSGNCQWFPFFEKTSNHYFAIDANHISLSLAPENEKLTTLNLNVFDNKFNLSQTITDKIDVAFLSFFCSHFSDKSIHSLFDKLTSVNCILIVDSFWSIKHKEKYLSKELKEVRRNTSEKEHINILKRFFEFSDVKEIATTFGYSIIKFQDGNYWFACLMQKD